MTCLPGKLHGAPALPHREDAASNGPKRLFDPSVCDVELTKNVLQLALLLDNVYLVHGHGAVSTAHTDDDMAASITPAGVRPAASRRACNRKAKPLKHKTLGTRKTRMNTDLIRIHPRLHPRSRIKPPRNPGIRTQRRPLPSLTGVAPAR